MQHYSLQIDQNHSPSAKICVICGSDNHGPKAADDRGDCAAPTPSIGETQNLPRT